jgi:hypothetical protein
VKVYAFFLILAVTAAACTPAKPRERLKTDAELIADFNEQRASFDSLAMMLDEDSTVTFMNGYAFGTRLPPEMPEGRKATYERLFHRTGVAYNIWADTAGVMLQTFVHKWDKQENNWLRGYYYARQPMHKKKIIETDLLAVPALPAEYESPTVYKHIVGRWYLFSDHGYNG